MDDTICQLRDGFCQRTARKVMGPHATEVCAHAENKALALRVLETEVTNAFGEAGANIRNGCVIRDQRV